MDPGGLAASKVLRAFCLSIILYTFPAGAVVLSIEGGTAAPGGEVSADVKVDDAGGIAGGDIIILYDPNVLSANAVTASEIVAGGGITLLPNLTSAGEVRVSLAGVSALPAGPAVLFTIRFNVDGHADSGQYVLSVSKARLRDELASAEDAQVIEGAITVTGEIDETADAGTPRLLVRVVRSGVSFASPYEARANSRVAFSVYAYTEADTSDSQLVTDYRWKVPDDLGEPLSLGTLRVGTVAGKSGVVTFERDLATAEYTVSIVPSTLERLLIGSADVAVSLEEGIRIDPGGRIDFDARGVDRYGNEFALAGVNVAWTVVPPELGTIQERTGIFTAETDGEGYVIAVASGTLTFGTMAATLQGTGKITVGSVRPSGYRLLPNRPNPFNPTTWISYRIPEPAQVELTVHNLVGQEVATLVSGPVSAGQHSVKWDAAGHASGVYVVSLKANGFSQMRRIALIR